MTSIAAARARLAPVDRSQLTIAQRVVLAYRLERYIRTGQATGITLGPDYWRSWGVIAGRGYGKTFAIAIEFNRRVETGQCRKPALMAPTLDRVGEVQVANLVAHAPPWFKPEPYGKNSIRWPNGVTAETFSPESPGRPRSSNADLVWMTEIVDWQWSTRREAFNNITTATREGGAQYFWDTTSKGRNDVIKVLLEQHARDPRMHRLLRGSMLDNPVLGKTYLQDEIAKYGPGTRACDEEVFGKTFQESAGALWQQSWIDEHRVQFAPPSFELVIVGCDPALSTAPGSDETGLVTAGRLSGHFYPLRDLSGHHAPEHWGDLIVNEYLAGAAGVVIERNHIGDGGAAVVRARAKERGLRVEVLPRGDSKPIARTPGLIYIREVTSRNSKGQRAQSPAALYKAGRGHHVGVLDELEEEMTTWEPDQRGGDSPNRLDALCEAINELDGAFLAQPKSTTACTETARAQRELRRRIQERERRTGGWRLGR